VGSALLAWLLLLQPVSGAQTVAEPEPGCPDLGIEAPAGEGETPIPARVEGPLGVVALTFDAGADRGYAEDILDTLADAEVPATFGITGRWALTSPDLVERMAAEGHMVINHTFDHRSFSGRSDRLGGLSPAARQFEIEQADEIIGPLIGHTTCPWYRLPYGDGDARVVAQMAEIGYTQQVGWTVDTFGWRGARTQDIIARALGLAAPNAVYVMHVGIPSRDALALPSIIEGLRARGYGFAIVAALD
jgi:peptidoglycan-N-acetylglucosamine deacetylase